MSTHKFAVFGRGPDGLNKNPFKTSNSERELIAWLDANGARINKPGTNVFETEDGVVYEIRRGAF